MLKFLGALLLFAACAAAGQVISGNLRQRVRELAELKQGLGILETEIDYNATPLAQALVKVADRIGAQSGVIFAACAHLLTEQTGRSAEQLWQQALDDCRTNLSLNNGDLAILAQLGSGLGQTSRVDQVRKLRLVAEELDRRHNAAEQDCCRLSRVWQTLGWGSGLALVLLWL